MQDNLTYWAAEEHYSPRYLERCIEKVSAYRRYCTETGKTSKWQRCLQNYYGVSSDGTKGSSLVTRGGDSGQLTMAKINDYRNLIQHQLILITSQRPAGQAKAINSDTKSLHQARIASLLTEYYLSQVGWEQKFVRQAEGALVVDECFQVLEWDATLGDPIRNDPETGQMIMTGDSVLRVVYPWSMARDPYVDDPDSMTWGIYDYRVNKFDLATKFPTEADAILKGGTRKITEIGFASFSEKDTDQITVYVASHKPTPVCPQGRLSVFVEDALLLDGDFPYPEFNIYRMCQNDVIGTGFGYSNNSDILAIEEITDALHSIAMTNQTTFGTQAIIAPKGANMIHTEIAKGLAYFEVDPAHVDKIKPLQLTRTAPEIFQYMETLSRKKETLAGINSVVRGDPEGALRSNSGSALALVQAQSLQFNSGGQRSYYQNLSKINTGHIQLLQIYAQNQKVARIVGKVQSEYLKEFYWDRTSIENVSSVVFEPVDPIFQTYGGKLGAADSLLQKGMIKNSRQYITVARTGSLDVLTEDDEAMELAIKAENERLREGQPVRVITSENHEEHIFSHHAVIASPESKEDDALVNATLAHIQEHTQTWINLSQTNPSLLIATGQKVLPPPPPPMPPPGGPPPPPPGAAPSQGAPPPPHPGDGPLPMNHPKPMPQIFNGTPPAVQQASKVRPPNMPINPLTHQRAEVPGATTGTP